MIIKFENRYLDNFSHVFMDAKILNQGIGTKIILKEVYTVFAVVHETSFQIFLCNILAQEYMTHLRNVFRAQRPSRPHMTRWYSILSLALI